MKYYINTFKNIATKENGKFYFSDENLSVGMGERSPHVTFQLVLPYKDYTIYVSNITGTIYRGKYFCNLPLAIKAPDFTIETKSHLSTLFSFNKKQRFKIMSKNDKLIAYLKKSESLNVLNGIAKDYIFEPRIQGMNTTKGYEIIIQYHLEFDNWTQVLEPLIAFYKELIDVLVNRNYSAYNVLQS